MFRQFKFEEALYPKMEAIPLSTRFKLDSLGLALPVEAWGRMSLEERRVFCHLSIRSRGERECYTQYLAYVLKRLQVTLPTADKGLNRPWEDVSRLPGEVAQKMRDLDLPLFWPEWIKMDDMERYALYKLCLENAEGSLVRRAVQEFLGLTKTTPVALA